jgi:hypothetical protein
MFLLIVSALYFGLVGAGPNEPIPDNELGLYANQCATQFCHEKDGLELWLSLYQARNVEYVEPVWSPFEVANLCVMTAISGFTLGFLIQKFVIYELDIKHN